MPPRFQLELLGKVSVASVTGAPVPPELLQPRKLALLAYLAVEARAVPRPEIAGMMWGHVPEPRARASLNQLLHSIRRDCSLDPFAVEGGGVRLRSDIVECDVVRFQDNATRLPPRDVLDGVSTSFMPGFSLVGESGFEDWCAAQRSRFELVLADVAWRAAEACTDARERLTCLAVAAELRPWDEAVLRKRMRTHAETGDTASALALYEAFRRHVKEELGTAPAPATQSLAAELIQPAAAPIAAPVAVQPDETVAPQVGRVGAGLRARMRVSLPAALRGFGGRVKMACILTAGFAIGYWFVFASRADLPAIPVVSLAGLSISGPDEPASAELLSTLTALLSADNAYTLNVRDTAGARMLLGGTIALDAGQLGGTVILQSQDGTVAVTLPLAYSTESHAAATHDLAQRIRRAIAVAIAPDPEDRLAAELEQRIAAAVEHGQSGAHAVEAQTLTEIEADLESSGLRGSPRDRLASAIRERRAWNAFWQGQRAVAAGHFRKAIDALESDSAPRADATAQRLADLHYFTWVADSVSDEQRLERALRSSRNISPRGRGSETWLRQSAILYALGRYAESHAAADAARSLSAAAGLTPELLLLLFQSSFNARNDRTAGAECRRIREYMPGGWPSIACAAMLTGWTAERPYEFEDMLAAVRSLEDPEPLRAMHQDKLYLLIATAAARRGNLVLADSLMRERPDTGADVDGQVFRAAYFMVRDSTRLADALIEQLQGTADGARSLRSHTRLVTSR